MLSENHERFDRFDMLVTVLVFVDLLASIVLGTEHPKLLRWLLVGSAITFLLSWWVGRFFRVCRFIHDVRPSFTIRDNEDVWKRAKGLYRYLGISGKTMQLEFQSFLDTARLPVGFRIELLLLRPHSDFVRKSKDHELGRESTPEEVEAVSRAIEESARFYQGLRAKGLNIEVRFYSEYEGYWCHLVDHREALVGHMMMGESGLHSTVLHLKRTKREKDNVLLRFYFDEFVRLWPDAETADDYFLRKAERNA